MQSNLFGISGRIGSGKDLVGRIIQGVIANEINDTCKNISFTVDELLENGSCTDGELEQHSGWKIKKFAGKLKVVASLLTGIPVEKFEDQKFKKRALPNEWSVTKPYISGVVAVSHPMSVREFLQRLGTDAMRNGLHVNTWVNALFSDFEKSESKWICTDMRFPNEFSAIKGRSGITIRINREATVKENEHVSETALDGFAFDYVIDNSGTVEELIEKVRAILKEENVI